MSLAGLVPADVEIYNSDSPMQSAFLQNMSHHCGAKGVSLSKLRASLGVWFAQMGMNGRHHTKLANHFMAQGKVVQSHAI